MKTMKKYLILPVTLLTFAACHESKTPEEKVSTDAAPPVQTVAASASQITHRCAVLHTPDSIQLEHLKKDNGEEAFYTINDDYQNYMTDARAFLEEKGVKIIEPAGGKISFRSAKGDATTLNLSDVKYNWEMWLFDGDQLHKVDIMDIENEYKKYMK
ncbi:hypothetical protein [Chitinophaga sp.]|uniref:hypothetical protein n=1 Tax=Chitinophaga sp. TaxID=1869181 RepID=UPI002F9591AF